MLNHKCSDVNRHPDGLLNTHPALVLEFLLKLPMMNAEELVNGTDYGLSAQLDANSMLGKDAIADVQQPGRPRRAASCHPPAWLGAADGWLEYISKRGHRARAASRSGMQPPRGAVSACPCSPSCPK